MSTTRPRTRSTRLIAVAMAALVFAAAGPAHAQSQPAGDAPTFTPAPCARLTSGYAITFEERAGKRVTCGYVTVLENRAKPAGPTIDLPVVWFHAPDKSATDAVIYLSGGPGGAALGRWPIIDAPGFDAWLDGRDFILFDQRGTGIARPSLACRDLSAAIHESFTRVGDARSAVVDDAMRTCRDQLRDKGIDVAAYTTPASADDVEDIRTALGIDKLNLWGLSYGTRLALEVMRRHPGSVRSAVLDSVVPAHAARRRAHGESAGQRLAHRAADRDVRPNDVSQVASAHSQRGQGRLPLACAAAHALSGHARAHRTRHVDVGELRGLRVAHHRGGSARGGGDLAAPGSGG